MNKIELEENDVRDFFMKSICAYSATLDPSKQLTHKESLFLSECCRFNYYGGDLSDFDLLCEYFFEINFFRRRNDISQYKSKVAAKGFIKSSSKNEFVLPSFLDKKNIVKWDGDMMIKITYNHESDGGNSGKEVVRFLSKKYDNETQVSGDGSLQSDTSQSRDRNRSGERRRDHQLQKSETGNNFG